MNHPHGTRSRRQAGCECAPCRRANARYCKAYRLRLAANPDAVGVDATKTAEHISELLSLGMSYNAIAAAAHVNATTLKRMKDQRKTKADIERRVLAVTVTTPAGTHYIPALGTMRRIQALRAWGISQAEITRRTGIAKSSVTQISIGARPRVQSDTAARVRTMYDEVVMSPPVGRDRYERAAITRNKKLAAQLGYAVPFAWDDIDTDDAPDWGSSEPSHQVDPVAIARLCDGHRVEVAPEDQPMVIDELASKGMGDPEIGRGLGITARTVLRTRQKYAIPAGVTRTEKAAA